MWTRARPRYPKRCCTAPDASANSVAWTTADAFLDTESLEKQRGITIHAHQASVRCGNLDLTLLDTPGHVDFAAETERVLRVLDYAILVVSGTDGVQGHTETLWRLLARYQVPTFIFVNKMDAAGADRAVALADLRRRLSDAVYELPMVAPDSGTSGSVPLIEAPNGGRRRMPRTSPHSTNRRWTSIWKPAASPWRGCGP